MAYEETLSQMAMEEAQRHFQQQPRQESPEDRLDRDEWLGLERTKLLRVKAAGEKDHAANVLDRACAVSTDPNVRAAWMALKMATNHLKTLETGK